MERDRLLHFGVTLFIALIDDCQVSKTSLKLGFFVHRITKSLILKMFFGIWQTSIDIIEDYTEMQ